MGDNMGIELKFCTDMSVDSVSLVSNFNDTTLVKERMAKCGDIWTYKSNIRSGEYLYKFLIDNELLLNDPYANAYVIDDKNEIWSYLKVDKSGDRLFIEVDCSVNVSEFSLCSSITKLENIISKQVFNLSMDKQVVAKFRFDVVIGLHAVITSMKKNGWVGEPIDIVKMPDGNYTTIDNTRVAAARKADIDVKAVIHNADETLPTNQIDRFKTKKGTPDTWGEAVELRIKNQKNSFRKNNPKGANQIDEIR